MNLNNSKIYSGKKIVVWSGTAEDEPRNIDKITSSQLADNITIKNLKTEKTSVGLDQFITPSGIIFIGSSANTRFGETGYNLIFSSDAQTNNGLAIGTFNVNEDLILGVDNEPKIRIVESENVVRYLTNIDMNNNNINNIT